MVVEVSGIEIRSHGYSTILMSNMVATPIAKVYKLNFQFSSQLQWLNGRASVFGTEGCGFESHLEYQCGYQEIPGSNPGRDSSSRWPNGKAPDHGNKVLEFCGLGAPFLRACERFSWPPTAMKQPCRWSLR